MISPLRPSPYKITPSASAKRFSKNYMRLEGYGMLWGGKKNQPLYSRQIKNSIVEGLFDVRRGGSQYPLIRSHLHTEHRTIYFYEDSRVITITPDEGAKGTWRLTEKVFLLFLPRDIYLSVITRATLSPSRLAFRKDKKRAQKNERFLLQHILHITTHPFSKLSRSKVSIQSFFTPGFCSSPTQSCIICIITKSKH